MGLMQMGTGMIHIKHGETCNKRAFTLLELTMVLVIVMMTGLLVAPTLVNFKGSYDLEIAAKKLRAEIRNVQQKAINEGVNYRILFNTSTPEYTIFYESAPSVYDVARYGSLDNGIFFEYTDFMVPQTDVLEFDAFGTPLDDGNINLKDQMSDTIRVYVTAMTGMIEVLE
jgi:type II secretory pathway pseudopilin PulG